MLFDFSPLFKNVTAIVTLLDTQNRFGPMGCNLPTSVLSQRRVKNLPVAGKESSRADKSGIQVRGQGSSPLKGLSTAPQGMFSRY